MSLRMLNKIVCLFFLFFCLPTYAEQPNIMKVALLETFYTEMPLVPEISEYENAYFAGVEIAAHEAKQYGLTVHYKPFLYGAGSLDILDEVSKVYEWSPDLVMGPSSSDQCLLLKNHLKDIMILSSYASDVNLKNIPNFYSTLLPDDKIMQLLTDFIKNKFPTKNIYVIQQVDCKQCVDAGQLFISNYKKILHSNNIFEKKIIMDNINSIDAKSLIAGHEDDIIIVLNDSYFTYKNFIYYIASFFPNKRLIFFLRSG